MNVLSTDNADTFPAVKLDTDADPAMKEPILPIDDVSVVAFDMTADEMVVLRSAVESVPTEPMTLTRVFVVNEVAVRLVVVIP